MRTKRFINPGDILFDCIIYFLVFIIFFVTLYPFYFVLIMSFNEGIDAARGGIYFFPRKLTLANYEAFLNDIKWLTAFAISASRTIIGTLLTLIFTCLMAYGLSFKELVLRKIYIMIIIICMYFSGGLIPYYIVIKSLGLTNSFLVYIVPGMINLFYVLVAINFFQAIPDELRESAILDGAGEVVVFYKLIIPLSKPLVATIALFVGVAHWNAWFDSAFFISDRGLRTLSYLMMEVINKSQMNSIRADIVASADSRMTATTLSVQMTATIIAIAPIVCVYPFLQKYFIKGIMVGSVKG